MNGDDDLIPGVRDRLIERRLKPRRMAVDDKALTFLISAALPVNQDQTAMVDPIVHARRSNEPRFPHVVASYVDHLFGQAEGEDRRDAGYGRIGSHSENWITRPDDSGAKKRARRGQEGRIGCYELVFF